MRKTNWFLGPYQPQNALQNRGFCPFQASFAPRDGQITGGYMAFQICSGTRESTGHASTGRKVCRKLKAAENGKRLFFNTNEASMLLKTKDDGFENTRNELGSGRSLAPKCTLNSRFLAVRDPLSPSPGQFTWGYMAGGVIEKDLKMMGTNSTSPLLSTKASKKPTLRVGSWKLFRSGTAQWPRDVLNALSAAMHGRCRKAWHSGSLSASRPACAPTAKLTNECTDARRTNRRWISEA